MGEPAIGDARPSGIGPRQTEADLALGSVVAGRFEIRRVIGTGSMSTVYAAEHRGVGRPVAVKVLRRSLAADPDLVRRFRAEARDAAAVGHPNIVEVFDTGDLPDGRPFLVMERLDGRTVYEELLSRGRFPIARACRIARDVARALAAAHGLGIVHRDPKAENVMLVPRAGMETVKVIDFGIAAHYTAQTVRHTLPGVVMGTPEYMAPELAADARPTPALDVYGLGVLLFEMATGGPPFRERDPRTMLLHKLRATAPKLDERRSGAPAELTELVARCLATDPAARPDGAAEVADRLDAILAALDGVGASRGVSAAARTPGAVRESAATGRAALGVLSIAAVLAFALWPTPEGADVPRDAPPRARPSTHETVAPASTPDTPLVDAIAGTAASEAIEPAIDPATTAVGETPPPRAPKRSFAARASAAIAPPVMFASEPTLHGDDCVRERKRVLDARAVHDWDGMLRHIGATRCWFDEVERAKLRTKALMELGRFEECIAVGGDLADVDAVRWVDICERRLE
jgi:serine/threonine-protein kinase